MGPKSSRPTKFVLKRTQSPLFTNNLLALVSCLRAHCSPSCSPSLERSVCSSTSSTWSPAGLLQRGRVLRLPRPCRCRCCPRPSRRGWALRRRRGRGRLGHDAALFLGTKAGELVQAFCRLRVQAVLKTKGSQCWTWPRALALDVQLSPRLQSKGRHRTLSSPELLPHPLQRKPEVLARVLPRQWDSALSGSSGQIPSPEKAIKINPSLRRSSPKEAGGEPPKRLLFF